MPLLTTSPDYLSIWGHLSGGPEADMLGGRQTGCQTGLWAAWVRYLLAVRLGMYRTGKYHLASSPREYCLLARASHAPTLK